MPICLRFPVLQNYRYFKCCRNSLRIVASMWVNSLDVCVLPVVVCKKQRKRKIGSAFRKVLILRWGLLTDWLSNFGLYKWCFRVFGSAFAVARCDALIFMNVWAFFFDRSKQAVTFTSRVCVCVRESRRWSAILTWELSVCEYQLTFSCWRMTVKWQPASRWTMCKNFRSTGYTWWHSFLPIWDEL